MSSESQYEPYPYASKVHSWPFLAIPIEEGNNLMEPEEEESINEGYLH